jgi:hypothetical protein
MSAEVLPLANDVPLVVLPEMLARYGVGAFSVSEVGTRNVTVAIVPAVRANPLATVCTVGPAPGVAGANVTVMPLTTIVAVGNPLPVKRTGCTFGSAAEGDADAGSVTTAEEVDDWLAVRASSELSEDAAFSSVPQLVTPRQRKRTTKADAPNLVEGRLAEIWLRLRLKVEFGMMLGLRKVVFAHRIRAQLTGLPRTQEGSTPTNRRLEQNETFDCPRGPEEKGAIRIGERGGDALHVANTRHASRTTSPSSITLIAHYAKRLKLYRKAITVTS